MISLLITIIILGLIVWLVTTYIPMPAMFKKVVYALAAIILIVMLFRALGSGGDSLGMLTSPEQNIQLVI
jgi:hypothetical protein